MAETNTISAMVGAFIAVAILLGLGPQILGNTVMNCAPLPGYTPAGSTVQTAAQDANATGWAKTCITANTSTQSAYALLIIVLIIIAAVVILFVVKML